MVNSLNATQLQFQSPPTRERVSADTSSCREPVDTHLAAPQESKNALSHTLKAMACLALSLGPQVANAADVAPPPEVEMVATETPTEQTDERSLRDKAKDLKEKLDPSNYFNDYERKVGAYDLRVRPVDLDLKPKWKDGGPALRLKGEILETTLSKTEDLGGGWTKTQGAVAKLRGEASTYKDTEIDLEAGLFRDYQGPIGEDFQARFRSNVGVRHRFIGEHEGLRAGVSFRQELEGGEYETFGHSYQLYAEGRQSAYHNFDTGEMELSYKFMAGPKKDFDLTLLGKKATLSVTVGPEIKGSNRENRDPFELGVASKFRLRF